MCTEGKPMECSKCNPKFGGDKVDATSSVFTRCMPCPATCSTCDIDFLTKIIKCTACVDTTITATADIAAGC